MNPIRSEFGKIEKEEINIEDHMIFLEEYAMLHKKFSFRKVLENGSGKSYVIVTFLGILEMMTEKTGSFTIEQDELLGAALSLHIIPARSRRKNSEYKKVRSRCGGNIIFHGRGCRD